MARPIDPALRRARRLQIIDAGITAFAERGPQATIAQICSAAGIGSGTFFHHFASKESLVIAILELGTTETEDFFTVHEGGDTPRQLVIDYMDHMARELGDPRTAGFVLAVGAMSANQRITDALRRDEATTLDRLEHAVAAAQAERQARTDVSARRIANWALMLLDGLVAAIASGRVTAEDEMPMLHEQVRTLLDSPTAGATDSSTGTSPPGPGSRHRRSAPRAPRPGRR